MYHPQRPKNSPLIHGGARNATAGGNRKYIRYHRAAKALAIAYRDEAENEVYIGAL